MDKIRSIRETADMIKQADPDTCIKYNTIRRAVISGEIPSVKVGRKYLINYDGVLSYFGAKSNGRKEKS